MLKRFAVAAGAVVLGAVGASAQWLTSDGDNPFEKTKSKWVFTASTNGNGFGFRCEGSDTDKAALIFVTTEQVDEADAKALNFGKPLLAIIIDDGQRADLDAGIGTVELDGKSRLRISVPGQEAIDMAHKIALAKRRISVAAGMMGKTYHVTSFGVRGSKTQLEQAFKACGLKPAS